MIDGFGVVLAILRADAGVAAIAGTRIGAEMDATLPCVVLVDLATTRRPFGPGSGRLSQQLLVMAAKCYGADTPTGAITARQLAGAVSDALHDHGPYRGSSSRLMFRSYAPEIDGLDRDPDTRYPLYTVMVNAYLAAEAVA